MKTYQKNIIVIILLAIAIFIYINKNKKTQNPTELQTQTATTTDDKADIVVNDATDFYEIYATYPNEMRDKNSVMKKDITDIVKLKQQEWKTGGDLYNEEQKLKTQYPDRPSVKYELNIQYDKYESESKGTVSYVFKLYEFTGGAHGNTGLSTYTYDEKGLINVDKFLNLTDENSRALTSLLKEKLIVSLKDLYNPDMLNSGLSDIYTNFDNFVVLDEGIKFIFGQYQVAPYAAGQPEVLMSWGELKTFIKK
jgi:Deacetylase PdaC/Protein of unknown function (DUF3298)